MKSCSQPLTIIYECPRGISERLLASDGSAAFRIPKLDYTREICRRLGHPIVSTSANFSGCPTPTNFSEIEGKLREKVDYICYYGRDRAGACPSRIIKINNDGLKTIIRF